MAKLQVHYLPVEDRFLHVVHEVRYLVRAGVAWRLFGEGLASEPPPIKVSVEGIGEVDGLGWVYGMMHAGTVGMFQREGFNAVAARGSGPRVVMHKRV